MTAAEPHGQSEEIDRQENIDAKCFRITDHAAEKCADYRCQYPGHPYDCAHCEIPAKRRRFSSIFAFYRLCELRIDEQEKSKPALDVRITADDRSECRGIEDMAKVYCQNGQYDDPCGDVMAKQLDADQLAGTTIDKTAHKGRFCNAKTVVDRNGAKKDAERGR
ncbi:hypothetical protein D3C87_1629690 [compost metagenome]